MAEQLFATSIRDYLPPQVGQIRNEIEQLPRSIRDRMLPLCDKICHFICLQGRLLEMAQEAAERLELDVKYLTFDRDVTRRERDDLRAELENLMEGWQ